MFKDFKNSRKQGDAGVGVAIAHYCMLGCCVCVPLTDSQDFDLVVEIDGELKKVQSRTTGHRAPSGSYEVGLRVLGGNSKNNYVHKTADVIEYDILFVLTDSGDKYVIPKADIKHIRNSITLGKKYQKYKVK